MKFEKTEFCLTIPALLYSDLDIMPVSSSYSETNFISTDMKLCYKELGVTYIEYIDPHHGTDVYFDSMECELKFRMKYL